MLSKGMSTGRILSETGCREIGERIHSFSRSGNIRSIVIRSWWQGEMRWARNEVHLASDRRGMRINVTAQVAGSYGSASTNQIDDLSIESLVHAAERSAQVYPKRVEDSFPTSPPAFDIPDSPIWSDSTYQLETETRAEIARLLVEKVKPRGFLAAGYLEVRGAEMASIDEGGNLTFHPYTHAQFSATVRDAINSGSGWAGLSGYEWSSIDAVRLGYRALEKCIRSLNPVRIEPGRYTVILEPQAVGDIVSPLVRALTDRAHHESQSRGPFTAGYDASLGIIRTKLGLKVIDDRISISHEPADPRLGIVPFPSLRPITWIDKGVLKTLDYSRSFVSARERYSLPKLNDNIPEVGRLSFKLTGGDASIDDMIQSTSRGILVTRFWDVDVIEGNSLLCTGFTRDGLFLIEGGKVSRAINNFRFTESPLFALNQVEQLGVPESIFRPTSGGLNPILMGTVVPALKINDFSFTSTVDAV